MDFTASLKALETSALAVGIRNSLYFFPFLEAIHVMAFSLVFGTIVVVDLRVLGLASRQRPFTRMSSELLKITWCGFILAALTGSIMFTTNARVYIHDTAFLVKMALLLLAGLNMAVFQFTAGRSASTWDDAPRGPGIGRVTAAASLALWVAILVSGRVIGFTTTGAQAKQAPQPVGNFEDFLNGAPDGAPASAPAPSSAAAPAP